MEKLDRNELYKKLKALNLQDKIKEIYGKNFTQVSSAELNKLIDEEEKLISIATIDEEDLEEELSVKPIAEHKKAIDQSKDESLTQVVFKLVTKLRQIRVISEADVNYILGEL